MPVLLAPISARRQLNELSDEMVMKLSILYYVDAREALKKDWGIEPPARHEARGR